MMSPVLKRMMAVMCVTYGVGCGGEGPEPSPAQEGQQPETVAAGEVYFDVDETGQVQQAVSGAWCSWEPCIITGNLDAVHTTQRWAGGWACNNDYPSTYLSVLIHKRNPYTGGWYLVGSGTASNYRSDLVGACGGSGYHGFHIPLSEGGAGQYRMYVQHSNWQPIYDAAQYYY